MRPTGLRSRIAHTGLPDSAWGTTYHEFWWEAHIEGWVVALRCREHDSRVEVSEVRIFPDDGSDVWQAGEWDKSTHPSSPLPPSKVLRKANITSRLAEARAAIAAEAAEVRFPDGPAELWDLSDLPILDSGFSDLTRVAERSPREHPGSKGHDDVHYLRFAILYHRALQDKTKARRATAVVAEATGEKHTYVSKTIRKCRPDNRALLDAPPSERRAGGGLTEKAWKLIRDLGWERQVRQMPWDNLVQWFGF
jgi:hypothetical protein